MSEEIKKEKTSKNKKILYAMYHTNMYDNEIHYSKEIDNIVENSVKYFNKDNTIESVSSIFVLEDGYFSSKLNCNNCPFFFIDKKTLVPEEYTIIPFRVEYDTLPKITIEDKQKLLTKIMVPRGFLN